MRERQVTPLPHFNRRTAVFLAVAIAVAIFSSVPVGSPSNTGELAGNGIVTARSDYPMADTVPRLRADIEGKGI